MAHLAPFLIEWVKDAIASLERALALAPEEIRDGAEFDEAVQAIGAMRELLQAWTELELENPEFLLEEE